MNSPMRALEIGFGLLREDLLGPNPLVAPAGTATRMNSRKPRSHSLMPATATSIEVAVGHSVDHHDLLLDRHRAVLGLLEDLDRARAALELLLGRRVEIRCEGRESFELAVLRQIEPQSAGDRAHRLDLRRTADARDGNSDVDRGTDAGEEEVGLEEDLSVGDRDDVGRDVCGDVAGLRLDDRERGERSARLYDERAVDDRRILAQLRGSLEQA